MFGFLKKLKQNKEDKKMAKSIDEMTEEEINQYLTSRKAKEPSKQTEDAKVDESVAMKEKESGTQDSQTAKDRVDESEGMSKAAGSSAPQTQAAPLQEAAPQVEQGADVMTMLKTIQVEMARMAEEIKAIKATPMPADDSVSDKLNVLERRFSN